VLERFSEEARRAVRSAGEEAARLGHGRIGTEHLLIGLVAARGTAASEALAAAGVSIAPCREKVIEALASRAGSPVAAEKELPFTDRASRALDRAGKLSLRMSSQEVRSGHLLLSVLDVEGTAGQVLRGLGVDPAAVRQALASAASPSEAWRDRSHGSVATATPEPQHDTPRRVAGPVCGTCGAPLDSSLDHVVVRVGSDDPVARVDILYCTVCGTAIGTTAVAPERPDS
jgi:ATP-dependent Clp protease ATP-binding subunit ClpA